MTQREPVTLPQETVTMAMMAAAICCALISYVAVRAFELAGAGTYVFWGCWWDGSDWVRGAARDGDVDR